MTSARRFAAGAVALVAAAAVGWLAARAGVEDRVRDAETAAESAREQASDLAAEVARLRAEVGAADAVRARGAAAPSSPPLRPTVDDHAARIAALEAALAAGPPGSAAGAMPPARGRQVLADLLANRDGTRVAAIRAAIQDLVRVGDPIVPEIASTLDAGLDTRYVEHRPLLQHLKGYDSVRMVLNEALREIGTPAAWDALVASARKSGRSADFRDVICPSMSSTDAARVERIDELVPEMLRSLAATPIRGQGSEGDAMDLSWAVAAWIRKRGTPGTTELLADVLRSMPSDEAGAWTTAYSGLFQVLLESAPERAAAVALEFQQRAEKPGGLSLWRISDDVAKRTPRAKLVSYYGVLLSAAGVPPDDRFLLARDLPERGLGTIKDLAARERDTRAFVVFLEERLRVETEQRVRDALAQKLESLRKDLETPAR
jgi:hypothetical protein